jgi:hypothetical protein
VPQAPPSPQPWPALRREALRHSDAHVVKLVDACAQWQQRDPDGGPWAAAATRALQG